MATVVAFQITSILQPIVDEESGLMIDEYSFFGTSGSLSSVKSEWVRNQQSLFPPEVGDYVVVPENLKPFLLPKKNFEEQYEFVAKGSPWIRAMGDEYRTKERT